MLFTLESPIELSVACRDLISRNFPYHLLLSIILPSNLPSNTFESSQTSLALRPCSRLCEMQKWPQKWSDEESAIAIYFTSRGLSHAVSSEVIKPRCGTTRTPSACQQKVPSVREKMKNLGLVDPLNPTTLKYDHSVVAYWLRHKMKMKMEKLKELLAVNAQVEEIMRTNVCSLHIYLTVVLSELVTGFPRG